MKLGDNLEFNLLGDALLDMIHEWNQAAERFRNEPATPRSCLAACKNGYQMIIFRGTQEEASAIRKMLAEIDGD